jgi:predicted Zn finger-like uncharacterized protein
MLDTVEIFCPHCFANFFVSPERIPEDGVTTPCKKCDKNFTMMKASGDPVRDRASRQQGFVVIQEKKRRSPEQEFNGYSSGEITQRKLAESKRFKKKILRLGASAAAVVLVVAVGVFYLWKSSVHGRIEVGLKNALAQVSNSRFEFKMEDIQFSALGGLTRERGCLRGLALSDRETRKILCQADKVYFQMDPSKKEFVTEPFTLMINVHNSKIILNGCVVEAGEADGWHAVFKAKEGASELEGMDMFTGQGIEVTLNFKGGEWNADPRFLLGHADLGLKVKEVKSTSASVSKNVDIRLSLKNGLFPKQGDRAQSGSVNYTETVKTKWGESKAVASIDRCSLGILGSAVQLAGKLEFRNPPEESEADLSFKAKDFSRIMKFIHRLNTDTFDRIVLTLIDLDEKNVSLYAPNADSLDLNLSYRTSRIKLNEKELKPLT